MKKRVKKHRLRKPVKKVLITLVLLIADLFIYHFLGIYGFLATQNTWASTFILVGWFWLLAGQFVLLYLIWEW